MGVAELKKLIDDAREELQRKQKQCHDSENEKIKMKKEFEDEPVLKTYSTAGGVKTRY